MFELEIMVTGYTLVVATTSVVIAKCIGRKQFRFLSDELSAVRAELLHVEGEIKAMKKDLKTCKTEVLERKESS